MQTFGLFLYIFIIGFVYSHDSEGCDPPYHRVGLGCYYISNDRVNGDEAFARCLKRGGYLANLETIEEALALKSVLVKKNTGLHYYVGGRNINRFKTNGDWRWIKNGKMTPIEYFAFGAGEPNGNLGSPQDCMFFYVTDKYNMHSVWCYSSAYDGGYICEK